jgi:signal peptidase I
MFPNINIDDRVLVVKDEIINFEYDLGDIVVFYAPQSSIPLSTDLLISNLKIWNLVTQNEINNQGTVYIKRIVGTPGDQVNIESNGSIFVNNIELEIKNVNNTNNGDKFDIKLSENEYFLVGDNRDNSFDSRMFGPISSDRIIGKAYFKIYPFSEFKNLND